MKTLLMMIRYASCVVVTYAGIFALAFYSEPALDFINDTWYLFTGVNEFEIIIILSLIGGAILYVIETFVESLIRDIISATKAIYRHLAKS